MRCVLVHASSSADDSTEGQVRRLQTVLHAAARLISGVRLYDHITPTLRDTLHWLPVAERINYKIVMMAFSSVHWGWVRSKSGARIDGRHWAADVPEVGRTRATDVATSGTSAAQWRPSMRAPDFGRLTAGIRLSLGPVEDAMDPAVSASPLLPSGTIFPYNSEPSISAVNNSQEDSRLTCLRVPMRWRYPWERLLNGCRLMEMIDLRNHELSIRWSCEEMISRGHVTCFL